MIPPAFCALYGDDELLLGVAGRDGRVSEVCVI